MTINTENGISFIAPNAFVAPDGSNLDQVREFANRIVSMTLELRASSAARPFKARDDWLPGDVKLDAIPVDEEIIVEKLRSLLEGTANTESPDFIAHMGAFPTAISALGDFVASTINNNLIGLELSPTFSLLEDALTKEFARFFGLPVSSGGLIATGGSLSNLHAMAVARNAVLSETMKHGTHGLSGAPCVLASEAAHASIEKNAMILGLGTGGAIRVATDSNSRMMMTDLEDKFDVARSQGRIPFCVVATAGTTVTGNIDPLPEIAKFALDNKLWFHVDAAWGGGLQFTESFKRRLSGIELADSITFCPQKLLLVALSSSLTLFRDWTRMQRNFRVNFSYLKDSGEFTDRSEIGVQGSRAAEVLKLWLSMQHIGISGYGALIEKWVGLADRVAEFAQRRDYVEIASEPESAIICFRFCPSGLTSDEIDDLNDRLHCLIHDEKGIYLSKVRYKGCIWLRAVFQNPFTQPTIVDRLFQIIDRFASE